MTGERVSRRRHAPSPEPLEYAKACQLAIVQAVTRAESERGRAFLSAASAGWTMRDIAGATGLSPSTVCRIINAAEGSA